MSTHVEEAEAPDEAIVELDEVSIGEVAGGLNPQPLPPGRAMRLD